ncbi:class I SAM-dependent methyltransferase [Paenibacillus alkaliterrae]|uniref:class I SAM-dependent DNA methyltransferase n=1 Tax=Paenibacillus alkaliterrae TaxID=320909 RepID=UPI001F36CDB9|nr:class I SAM-dependent methyltransferase [Paenibacillus alkaliterrae]MCF2941590.1 class I SAM-dependent methyltransferase [Paenibacillus alkaliterrae]
MGREFIELFDHWADHYDLTVWGHDEEYKEAFQSYDAILEAVAERSNGTALEFGAGTGNLTEKLLRRCSRVYAVEPSTGMRKQFEKRGLEAELLEGDFLQFPLIPDQVDTIVSTYAFHHLTDAEKEQAIALYSTLLVENGQIIFADTSFQDEEARKQIETDAEQAGHMKLLHDLQNEYFTTNNVLERICKTHGLAVSFEQLNRYVWLMHARKEST